MIQLVIIGRHRLLILIRNPPAPYPRPSPPTHSINARLPSIRALRVSVSLTVPNSALWFQSSHSSILLSRRIVCARPDHQAVSSRHGKKPSVHSAHHSKHASLTGGTANFFLIGFSGFTDDAIFVLSSNASAGNSKSIFAIS